MKEKPLSLATICNYLYHHSKKKALKKLQKKKKKRWLTILQRLTGNMALAIPCRIFFLLIILHQFCLFFFSFLFINIFHSFSLLFLLHLSFSSFRQWSRQKVRPFFRHCLSENMATKPTFFFKNQIQSAISSQNMPFLAFLDAALIF